MITNNMATKRLNGTRWGMALLLSFGVGSCSIRGVTDNYPNEIKKGRAMLFARSTTDISLHVKLFQDVMGKRESLGVVNALSHTRQPLGGFTSSAHDCLLTYAPPGETRFYVGKNSITVPIFEGRTTPVIISVDPQLVSGNWGVYSVSFEVLPEINNLRMVNNECFLPGITDWWGRPIPARSRRQVGKRGVSGPPDQDPFEGSSR